MPSPLVHSFLPAACLLVSSPPKPTKTYLRLFLSGAVIANLPDLDLIPATLITGHFADLHRALGHNIFSLALWAYLGMRLLRWADSSQQNDRRYCLAAFLLAASHIFLDGAGHFNRFGFSPTVPLFWPLSLHAFSLPFRIFITMDFGFKPPEISWRLMQTSFWYEIFFCEILPSLFLLGLWVALNRVYVYLKKRTVPQTLRDRPWPLTRGE